MHLDCVRTQNKPTQNPGPFCCKTTVPQTAPPCCSSRLYNLVNSIIVCFICDVTRWGYNTKLAGSLLSKMTDEWISMVSHLKKHLNRAMASDNKTFQNIATLQKVGSAKRIIIPTWNIPFLLAFSGRIQDLSLLIVSPDVENTLSDGVEEAWTHR